MDLLVSRLNSRMYNHNEVEVQHDMLLEELQIHKPALVVQAALMRLGACLVEAQCCKEGLGMGCKTVGPEEVGPKALGMVHNSLEAVGEEGPCIVEEVDDSLLCLLVVAPQPVVVPVQALQECLVPQECRLCWEDLAGGLVRRWGNPGEVASVHSRVWLVGVA